MYQSSPSLPTSETMMSVMSAEWKQRVATSGTWLDDPFSSGIESYPEKLECAP